MTNFDKTKQKRRQALKSIAFAGTIGALPTEWKKPIVNAVLLPAHAQTSTTSTTTPAPTTTCAPVSLTFSYLANPVFISNQTTPVTHTAAVTNNGPGRVSSFTVQESRPSTGETFPLLTGGPIEPGDTAMLTSSRAYVYSLGETVQVQAVLSALDSCGGQTSDTQSVNIITIGANMAIYASQNSVSPGDEIQIKLVSRLYATGVEDAQWIDMKYRCNLLGNTWRPGGPADRHWADPSDDYVNQRLGANQLALDMNEASDHGTQPDWIHEFTYKVPDNLAADLIISAEDAGLGRVYRNSKWSEALPLNKGFDQLTLSLER